MKVSRTLLELIMKKFRFLLSSVLLSCLWTPLAQANEKPEIDKKLQAQLLKLATDKSCNPESELYCKAHTVFVQDDHALVLLSIEPTAGIMMLYKQQKDTKKWEFKESTTLVAYEYELEAMYLPKAVFDHFRAQLDKKYMREQ